ncbi:hypothetical protein N8996_07355 [Candidatus Poseidonia alphae]|nr:hypothetical protein [Candidatus Poseidonia alphae]
MRNCVSAAGALTELWPAIYSHLTPTDEVVGYEGVSLTHHHAPTQTRMRKGFKSSHLHDPTDVLNS